MDDIRELAQEEPAAEAIVGMVTAAVGLIEPGLSVPLAGAIPYLARGLAQIFQRSVERQALVVKTAAEQVGANPGELLETLLADPRGEQMFRHAMTSARDATVEAKLQVIARALASGAIAKDEAVVDTEILFLRAMEDVEIPHVRALRIFTSTEAAGKAGHPITPNDKTPIQLKYPDFHELLPQMSAALDPVLATLERHGLLARIATGGGAFLGGEGASTAWRITAFGKESLARLETWNDSPAANS